MTAVFAFKRETLFTIKLTHKFSLLTITIPPSQTRSGIFIYSRTYYVTLLKFTCQNRSHYVTISLPQRTCTYGLGRVGEAFESVSGSVQGT